MGSIQIGWRYSLNYMYIAKIESNSEGKDLLQRQLKLVKKLKNKIVEETDNEMAIFKKFREFSKDNPGLTYEEFIKQWRST